MAVLQADKSALKDTDEDPRFHPTYTLAEAGRILNIPSSTLRYWTKGRYYETKSGEEKSNPIISLPDPKKTELSFINLIESHALRALRTSHEVSMRAVREALQVAEEKYDIKHLLIHSKLRTEAGQLFLKEYGKLTELNHSQQIVLEEMFRGYLDRIEYDDSNLPVSFYPLIRGPKDIEAPKDIVLDPSISFGRPVIEGKGISTHAIESRIASGESIIHVAKDYGLTKEEVREALVFEVAA